MKLTMPESGAKPRISSSNNRTTVPGYTNRHRQQVIEGTGAPSETHSNQRVYRMKCLKCSNQYGSNGCDIFERRCPKCSGAPKANRWSRNLRRYLDSLIWPIWIAIFVLMLSSLKLDNVNAKLFKVFPVECCDHHSVINSNRGNHRIHRARKSLLGYFHQIS